jgi:hypothetical protein
MMGGMIVLFSSSTMHAGEWNDGKLLGKDEGLVELTKEKGSMTSP